jgi:hypothetical protein
MAIRRAIGLWLALCAVLAVLAPPASAGVKLSVQRASDKAYLFARHVCAHDPNCERYGVTSCRRQSMRVVLCRIFDDRDTRVQGKYRCTRLVRIAYDPAIRRVVVTGVSDWDC